MTNQESAAVVAMLKASYPNQKIEQATLMAYQNALAEGSSPRRINVASPAPHGLESAPAFPLPLRIWATNATAHASGLRASAY